MLSAGRLTDSIIEVAHGHAPVVAHEPFHGAWADQFHEGKLEGLRERLDNIGAHVVHGALFDEGFEEPHAANAFLRQLNSDPLTVTAILQHAPTSNGSSNPSKGWSTV